ncbi:NADPH dehydrogenase [Variibacter gotjawalensis]|uniref:NADPH dehydrogenase n=1 Tax=Variibacter gotjawalensis TaxID=1333996 RepID=A0A0S3PZE0_9BRAD|nr:NADH:flavin oxidoreductase/NADH oxidase [Variibacter gotjawalensis]NIK47149.1 NADPH2 dehydrogenase [Variibacter gotjawalensis]RZS49049.1 2,4-dienoyl-CoA reductase-like NADH-dependent reductase (Old Yellow Enzyme family) [Variibacter gotjawalensis]BAT61311.1 NADPH dehydrogenase [Variibacter gotjawalensis]
MSALFSPIRLGDLELSNRIVVAPMCQYSADDGCANDWHTTHLGMLANSGAGLVVIEATHVDRAARITHGCVGLYSDANEAALARVIAHCKRIGTAKFAVQLAHSGRKGSSQRPWEGGKGLHQNGGLDQPWPTIGPSAITFGEGWAVPREMEKADFERVTEQFVEAAKRAVRLGFDAAEMHIAHGYLLHSIASPISNKRSDGYSAGRQAGWRFIAEIAEAIRAAVPKGFPVGARITGSDWADGGMTPDDCVALATMLREAGLDYIDVSSGGVAAGIHNPTHPGYNVPMAERVKREAGIASRAVGLIADPAHAEEIIASGKADQVALGRAFLDNPHWGWMAAEALGADVARPPQYLRVGRKMWAKPGKA